MSSTNNFIDSNSYPSYDEMNELLNSRLDLSSEYGLSNHQFCKDLYKNFFKDDKIEEIIKKSKKIYSSGGRQALFCNLETIQLYSPLSKCNDENLVKNFYYTVLIIKEHFIEDNDETL
jgi:hypothetical protein